VTHILHLLQVAILTFHTDIFDAGVVLSTVAALIALTSSFSLLVLVMGHKCNKSPFVLRIASCFLAFCTIWLFATLIPYDHFYATGSAKVTATIGGIAISQATIQAVEKTTGVTGVYKHIHYSACSYSHQRFLY
jgi:hypothetical protein